MSRASPGYTLIEALVMLAIVAVVSTLVLEAIRQATASGIRIERVARNSVHNHLDIAAARALIGSTRITYHESERRFIGAPQAFSGATDAPLGPGSLANSAFSARLVTETDRVVLVISEQSGEWIVKEWPAGAATFQYWDPTGRVWRQSWPPEDRTWTHFAPTPTAIRVRHQTDNSNETIVFALASTAPPPFRAEDLIRGGSN